MNAHSSQFGFIDYVAMVWSRRSTALLAAGLFACVTFIAFNFVPRRYTATCVFERQGNLISSRTNGLPESFANLKPLIVHHTTGEQAIRKALEDLGYTKDLPVDATGHLTPDSAGKLNAMVKETHRNLHFSWIIRQKDRDRMSLQLSSGDPILAYSLPNQLVKNYIAETHDKLIAQLNSSATYLRQQIAEADAESARIQQEQFDFLKGHPDMMPGNPQFLTQQIERLRDDLEDLQRRRQSLDSRLAIMKDMEINGSADMVVNPEYLALVEGLQAMEAKLKTMRATMTDRHPKVVRLRRLIAETRVKASSTPQSIAAATVIGPGAPNKAHAQLRIEDVQDEMAQVDATVKRKEELLARSTKAQANFLPISRQYAALSTQLQTIDKEKRMWDKNLADVKRALAAEKNGTRTNLAVIRPAAQVYRPSWPALWHVFVLAIGGGLAFGVTLAIMMNRLSRSFETPEDARTELGLPVLGVVGPILTPAARRMRSIRRYVITPAAVAVLLAVTFLAAAGVVMSANYPGRYAQIMEHVTPTTRAMWHGVASLLGLM